MSILSQLEDTYKSRLKDEQYAKNKYDLANKKLNNALSVYDLAEGKWYKIPESGKVSLVCKHDGVEYIGSEPLIKLACEYVRCVKSGASWFACSPYKVGNEYVQSEYYKITKNIVLAYRKALSERDMAETEHSAAKEFYNNARVLTGKALNALTEWKIENMTPEQLETLENENKVFESAIDIFSWKTIGIGAGVVALLFGLVWWIKNR